MVLEARCVRYGRTEVVEYSRPDASTVYLLSPTLAAEVERCRDEMTRWRLVKMHHFATRQKKQGEQP